MYIEMLVEEIPKDNLEFTENMRKIFESDSPFFNCHYNQVKSNDSMGLVRFAQIRNANSGKRVSKPPYSRETSPKYPSSRRSSHRKERRKRTKQRPQITYQMKITTMISRPLKES